MAPTPSFIPGGEPLVVGASGLVRLSGSQGTPPIKMLLLLSFLRLTAVPLGFAPVSTTR